VEVVAAARSPRALAFRSRHVTSCVEQPASSEELVDFIIETTRAQRIDVVLPLGQESIAALANDADAVHEAVAVALPSPEAVAIASSKRRTLEFARAAGLRTPIVVSRTNPTFPAVAKAEAGSGAVRYVASASELAAVPADWIVQEYVPGEGRGLFALFDHGTECAVFAHRRLREWPATGGASTAAESVDDPTLRELGLRLLRELSWNGVAMVEFKVDARDGSHVLMEINPKFWGSLELAIAAGVDFPWLAVQLALGEEFEPPTFAVGRRLQWFWSDALRTLSRPRDAPQFVLDVLNPKVATDFALRDPVPSLLEGAYTAVAAWRAIGSRSLRYPHGRPSDSR